MKSLYFLYDCFQVESGDEVSTKKPKTEVVAKSGKSDTHGVGVSAEVKQNKEENKTSDSEVKKGEINKDKEETNIGDSDVKAGEESKDKTKESAESKSKQSENTRDDIEENLQCIICQEIMHDCIR